ncbi:hypothetical protein OUZ56_012238 [Daphnia magna]|uniref:Uncharacterized protein n=1 Tax=Daphnia magna TaxID=35525 RepID=A0ABQ9Z2F6_9CRUS|nr:hypothetical protein OUZ56_012238 [Daphnia magna]
MPCFRRYATTGRSLVKTHGADERPKGDPLLDVKILLKLTIQTVSTLVLTLRSTLRSLARRIARVVLRSRVGDYDSLGRTGPPRKPAFRARIQSRHYCDRDADFKAFASLAALTITSWKASPNRSSYSAPTEILIFLRIITVSASLIVIPMLVPLNLLGWQDGFDLILCCGGDCRTFFLTGAFPTVVLEPDVELELEELEKGNLNWARWAESINLNSMQESEGFGKQLSLKQSNKCLHIQVEQLQCMQSFNHVPYLVKAVEDTSPAAE